MLDTVKLLSPFLSPVVATAIENASATVIKSATQQGETLYRFTTGQLEGSFDHRLSYRLDGGTREADLATGELVRAGDVQLVIEGSVHKALLGHNMFGGPIDVRPAVRWLVDLVGSLLGVTLPDGLDWTVLQLDWAECYDLGSYQAVEAWMQAHKGVKYPRRATNAYGDTGLNFPGRFSTVKLYHKGPEFSKHDHCRLLKLWGVERVTALQETANSLLRCEVAVRRRLVADFGGWPKVSQIEPGYLERMHDTEFSRLLKEGETELEIVRNYQQVTARLQGLYTPQQASALLGTWTQLALLGEQVVKSRLRRSTWYDHRRKLLDAGCSWLTTDIYLAAPLYPIDFVPLTTDPRRVTGEAPEVAAALRPYLPPFQNRPLFSN